MTQLHPPVPMTSNDRQAGAFDDADALASMRAGDHAAFTALTERYRHELRVHCYRMLGSLDDAEDLVQDTLTKAWHHREHFEGRSSIRGWLYRIATNACLDFLGARRHRVLVDDTRSTDALADELPDVPWLQPYPDRWLDAAEPADAGPEGALLTRESVGLAFLVALQLLPPKQRAALILADVVEWSSQEIAELFGGSVASVNAALQRARATLRERAPRRAEATSARAADDTERALLSRYVAAHESFDMNALTKLLREDLRFSMPPHLGHHVGRDTVVAAWTKGGLGSPEFRDFRCVVTRTNRMPAVAIYRRKPNAGSYTPFALDVLELDGDRVAAITTFPLEPLVGHFDLPRSL